MMTKAPKAPPTDDVPRRCRSCGKVWPDGVRVPTGDTCESTKRRKAPPHKLTAVRCTYLVTDGTSRYVRVAKSAGEAVMRATRGRATERHPMVRVRLASVADLGEQPRETWIRSVWAYEAEGAA